MPNSLRHDFHSDLASTILHEIQYKRSNYYYFLGKVEAWSFGDIPPNDIPEDSDLENSMIRANSVFMRKITPNDITLVTTRYNWVSGTVFSTWDNTKNMVADKFYCVTDEFNVYKCLDNGGNSVSTVKPTGNSFYVLRTSDGYLWKYMYTVPTFKQSRFMNPVNLPVQKALTDSFYNRGSIDAVAIVNAGFGYTDAPLTTVTVTGTTTGAGAVGTIVCGIVGNITSVIITDGGSNYTAGVGIDFDTVGGTSAKCTAVISGGIITDITIINGGIGYTTGESILFSIGGGIVIPSVSRETGSITSLTIINGGNGYTSAPTLTVNGIGGTGKYGNPTALITSVIYQGSIVGTNITDPGLDYPVDTATSIVVQGDGTGALFSPVISDGNIVDVIVENSGVGYTNMILTVIGAGYEAKLTPIIGVSDFTSNQSIVEQTTVIGAIFSIIVEINGTDYSDQTTVVVTGDGIGCTASPVISGGIITHIIVHTYGSDYTYATISFVDPIRNTTVDLIDCIAYAIIPPNRGHGYDAVNELFGSTLAINTSLRQDTNLNKILQDYRQFGMIKNPTNIVTGRVLDIESSLLTHEVTFNTVTDLIIDEILIFNQIKFRVILITGNNVHLQQLGIKYTNPIGVFYSEIEGTRSYTSIALISSPIANKYSGSLLYVSNENPFTFNQEQGITIKTFLKF